MVKKTHRRGGFRGALRRAYHRVSKRRHSVAIVAGGAVTAIFLATDRGGTGDGNQYPSWCDMAANAMMGQKIVLRDTLINAARPIVNLKNWVPLGGGVAAKLVANKAFHMSVNLGKSWKVF